MASALAIGIRTESSLATVSPGSGQISAPAATASKRGAYTPFHGVFFYKLQGVPYSLTQQFMHRSFFIYEFMVFVNMKVLCMNECMNVCES